MAIEEEKQEEVEEIVQEKPKKIHVINEFLMRSSFNKKSAITLERLELDLELYQEHIQELFDLGIIVSATKTKFYLDEVVYEKYKKNQDKKFFLTLVSIIIPGILFLILGIAWLIM